MYREVLVALGAVVFCWQYLRPLHRDGPQVTTKNAEKIELNAWAEQLINRVEKLERASILILQQLDMYSKLVQNLTLSWEIDQKINQKEMKELLKRVRLEVKKLEAGNILQSESPQSPTEDAGKSSNPKKIRRTILRDNQRLVNEVTIVDPLKEYRNCDEALVYGQQTGVYQIKLQNYDEPFLALCEVEYMGGRWTVVHRRTNGSLDFYKNWADYRRGFGNVHKDGEFFVGLDKLHTLSNGSPTELLIRIDLLNSTRRFGHYDEFSIGDESDGYRLLLLGNFKGDTHDGFSLDNVDMQFSTYDRDNDRWKEFGCAELHNGAWWFNGGEGMVCGLSNLNGRYNDGEPIEQYSWYSYGKNIKFHEIMVRTKVQTND